MIFIKSEEVEKGLRRHGRVYLCGNLKNENGVKHIQTPTYEIGVSNYQEYTCEKAHLHSFNQEFNYVLCGALKVFMLLEKKEYLFVEGDFFVINKNEPYASKCLKGTRVMFSKFPGGNDKVLVEMDEKLTDWGQSWESVYRKEII